MEMRADSHHRNPELRRSLTRRVFGSMGLFGSTEFLTMVCGVVRNKLMAVWVGAMGVGLMGLFSTSLEMLSAIAQLGLRTSAVRSVASAHGEGLSRISLAVRRVGVFLGVCGAVLTVALSPLLSEITFGSQSYCWAFMLLSVAVFASAVRASESALLQGQGLLARLAKASFISAPLALLVSVPLIYFMGTVCILPVLLTYAVAPLAVLLFYRAPAVEGLGRVSLRSSLSEAMPIIRLGGYITVSSLAVWVAMYLILTVVNHIDGENAMGYYQAGYTVTIRYLGVVFTAMGMEYYPRISAAVGGGLRRSELMMRHQVKIVVLVITPLLVALVCFAPVVVRLLYSSAFESAVPMIMFAAPGIVFRGVSWAMQFVVLAKGEGKVYLAVELTSVALCVGLSVGAYCMWGLAGVGWAFTAWYGLYLLVVAAVNRRLFGIGLDRRGWMATMGSAALLAAIAVAMYLFL